MKYDAERWEEADRELRTQLEDLCQEDKDWEL